MYNNTIIIIRHILIHFLYKKCIRICLIQNIFHEWPQGIALAQCVGGTGFDPGRDTLIREAHLYGARLRFPIRGEG